MPTLEISGSRFEYLELGRGEPVVLVHGTGSASAQWRVLAEELSARYRVIAPDLYGYGASAPWPGRKAFALDCEAEIVLALLAHFGGRAHLVGHSYGGAVALQVARSHGDSLSTLTLIEPVAFHLLKETDAPIVAEITEVADNLAHALMSGEYVAGFGRFFNYWNGPEAFAQIPTEKRDALAARFPKVMLDFHATFNEPTRLEDFRSLAVPTLLMCGTRSPSPSRRICELLAGTLPAVQFKTLEGAGHMAPVTHPDQVNALIVAHLDSNSGHPSRPPAVAETPSGRDAARADRTAA
jgi:pimeloyl-ACP methyl ester carboxylesterase